MKWLSSLMLVTLLSGCLGNISLSDLATGGGAVLGAAAGNAVGLAPVGTALTTAGGAIAGAAVVAPLETVVDQLEAVPEEERAAALKTLTLINAVKDLGIWLIAGALLFFLIPLIIGYFLPNGKQRQQRAEMIKMKEKLFDNPNITMNDIK